MSFGEGKQTDKQSIVYRYISLELFDQIVLKFVICRNIVANAICTLPISGVAVTLAPICFLSHVK